MTEFKGRLRFVDKDIDGNLSIRKALATVKGIGVNLADSIAKVIKKELNISLKEKIGNLDDSQISKMEEIITNPEKHGLPNWLLNRRKDPAQGKDRHLVSSDLTFQTKKDIEKQMNMRSYVGVRHMFGLTVRGQRTKTSGRKGMTVGVVKAKQKPLKKKKTTAGKKK